MSNRTTCAIVKGALLLSITFILNTGCTTQAPPDIATPEPFFIAWMQVDMEIDPTDDEWSEPIELDYGFYPEEGGLPVMTRQEDGTYVATMIMNYPMNTTTLVCLEGARTLLPVAADVSVKITRPWGPGGKMIYSGRDFGLPRDGCFSVGMNEAGRSVISTL